MGRAKLVNPNRMRPIDVARFLGVSPHTFKGWQKAGTIEADFWENGRRYYTMETAKKLKSWMQD